MHASALCSTGTCTTTNYIPVTNMHSLHNYLFSSTINNHRPIEGSTATFLQSKNVSRPVATRTAVRTRLIAVPRAAAPSAAKRTTKTSASPIETRSACAIARRRKTASVAVSRARVQRVPRIVLTTICPVRSRTTVSRFAVTSAANGRRRMNRVKNR